MEMKIEFRENHLFIEGRDIELPYPIHEIQKVDSKIIIIYYYMSGPKQGQFKNCVAYDLQGNFLWTGEHPTTNENDVYLNFVKIYPLILANFAGFDCELDINNGKLKRATFSK
jgi:hypothetical protein